ncbi:SpoIID/LytB domain-containing protein, partial [Nocardioides aequoreus]|uniref:SpoIID/LytB domain-containing protein n=1 Tax=Nocardioides aequoreus TaxID=397278 RepID=UPI0004C3971A
MHLRRAVVTSAVLSTALAGALAVAVAPPASAERVSQSFTLPADGEVTVTGRGYGHGHGMSQYGARGAARQGLDHQQILGFYYPGTEAGKATGGIRVRITADTDGDTRAPAQSGLHLRRGSDARLLPARLGGERVSVWRMRTSGDRVLVAGYAGGSWRSFARVPKAGAFVRSGGAPVTLRLPSGDRTYRGVLRHDARMTINVVSLDDLVRGVVASEMPASWEPAAVRAQAVAARTYAAFDRAANKSRAWHTCDTTACQVYGGVGAEEPRGNAAVDATSRQVRTFDGAPAFTQFSSSNGGWSSQGSRSYLAAQADPYDDEKVSGNPNSVWRVTLTRKRLQAAYPSAGRVQRLVVTERDGNGSWKGRVEELKVVGSKRTVTVSGNAFRSSFGLRSSWFRFS